MRWVTAFQEVHASGGRGHTHGQHGHADPQQDPGQPPALPPAPTGRVAAAVSPTRAGWCGPLLSADPGTGFPRAARREPPCPGLTRLTWARPLIARGSLRHARAGRSARGKLTACVAVTAELALAAGSAAGTPVSGPPAPGTASYRAAGTRTSARGTTGTGTSDAGPARAWTIGSGTTRPGPRVGLPGTRGSRRGRYERVPARCLPGAEARTARIGLRAASGT